MTSQVPGRILMLMKGLSETKSEPPPTRSLLVPILGSPAQGLRETGWWVSATALEGFQSWFLCGPLCHPCVLFAWVLSPPPWFSVKSCYYI